MEFQNLAKQKILIIGNGEPAYAELEQKLCQNYDIFTIHKDSFSFERIKQNPTEFSALIVCSEIVARNEYELLNLFKRDSILSTIPILVFYKDDEWETCSECLSKGVVDVVTPSSRQDILCHRIEKAIRYQDSATFSEIERMLKELPSNIYLKDAEGRYVFATHYWHHLEHDDDPNWTIRGKTDVDIRKDQDNARMAMEADLELIRTGKGTAYTIEINVDNKREFFEVIKQPVKNGKHEITGIVGLINNVTDRELLRISLEESAMIDELTNVYNRRFLDMFLSKAIQNRRYPISIISADCNSLKKVNDTYGHIVGDEYIRMTALLFRTNASVQQKGCIFRVGGDEFVILLTETTQSEAEAIVQKLKTEAKNYSVHTIPLSIAYGVSCLENMSDDYKEQLDIADKRMYANKAEYKNTKN